MCTCYECLDCVPQLFVQLQSVIHNQHSVEGLTGCINLQGGGHEEDGGGGVVVVVGGCWLLHVCRIMSIQMQLLMLLGVMQ